ncbi:BgTH12-00706 [Blumeria graminis f. sp. triticale]|uniref:Elongator complex protein 1 n=1 Tax=Blumeria graminis f. sp. triticale TaxID=1689686 RepID=A0A9W4D7F2_BLUGR|nr:BgTH12-00706 [Blumeria graminis f. sp. triticale]
MKNLRHTRCQQWSSLHGRSITSSAWDTTNNSLLCCLGPNENDPVVELRRINLSSNPPVSLKIASWEAPCPNPELLHDEILNIHYFGDISTTCLVFAGGDVVIVRENPSIEEGSVEIVGSINEGITAARWSPDEELLAIMTKADTIVFMSRNFDGVVDIIMSSTDLNESYQVSVGWGKKETQFQGRGAKALKDPTLPEKIDEGTLSPKDDTKHRISWRGDGAFVAVSSIQDNKRRVIRVYSRDGSLESVSEPVDGLEGPLSWRPTGNLISGIQRIQDRVDVVFFERNGLRHGQFSLRLISTDIHSSDQILDLFWNSDSTVLAVVLANHIELWMMGNFHWYLKQQISFDNPLPTYPLVWHPERPLKLTILSKSSIFVNDFVFTISHAPSTFPQEHGVIAVVDGKIVKITPFRYANVPPPMALHEIEVPANVIDIAFGDNAQTFTILHQKGISCYEWCNIATLSNSPQLKKEFTFSRPDDPDSKFLQITSAGKNEAALLQTKASVTSVIRYSFDNDGYIKEVLGINDATSGPPLIITNISSFKMNNGVYIFTQDSNGDVRILTQGDKVINGHELSRNFVRIEIMPVGNEIIAFGMSSNGHLYANSRLLVKNCTSFFVTPLHLIFTTTSHVIKFIHITLLENLEIPQEDTETDERCRRIERGAQLLLAIPAEMKVILQMPRGNLETIFPRAMVLAEIRRLVEEKNFRKAFLHCRTQRVDMNIIYDQAPKLFLSNAGIFIDQVKKPAYIDLFLSSLREEDVTQTMYKDTKILGSQDNIFINKATQEPKLLDLKNYSKVNSICDAFLTIFSDRKAQSVQNIITANLCKLPPALNDGLLVVARLMEQSPDLVEKAIEHICFLADVNKLYDAALGLYNLELALLIAQQSQKDPREYLPFLQNLQKMSTARRQFEIDDHLGLYGKALAHLHALDEFTELQAYAQKHNLYCEALALYRYNSTKHTAIMALYASHLESKSQFWTAAVAYESLSNYSKATHCYISSGPSYWRQALFSALSQSPPISETALTNLAKSLYDALIESKHYQSASIIQLDYLSSTAEACRALCKGYLFADALYLVSLKKEPELLDSVIEPGLNEAFASSIELLADCKAQILAQVPRIKELRQKAMINPLSFYEGERSEALLDLPDDISIAASSRLSTNCSLFTRYTGKDGSVGTCGTGVSRATSKNRKREERKRARGKKGSVYEQEYLVQSVKRLIERVESNRGDIGRLVEGLIRRKMLEQARAIEGALGDLIEMFKSVINDVFDESCKTKDSSQAPVDGYGPGMTRGGDAVLQESLSATFERKEIPIISPFEKISLLG